MNFWHMQLHPDEPDWSREDIFNLVRVHGVIGLGEHWEGDRGQPNAFKNNANIGDIVIIRHQGPLCIVRITSDCIKNEGENKIDVWFPIYRRVELLDCNAFYVREEFQKLFKTGWSDGMYAPATFQNANNWNFANFWYSKINFKINMKVYINLLETNYNLILTGAPGTGKTYLAKQIAAQMILGCEYDEKNADHNKKKDEQFDFVQFHPSYDYTDFIEGLRPIHEQGSIGFKREDGVFMAFCRKALKAYNAVENKEDAPKYVFVIDEINRGELSKIFGELFFSIDPGYRGSKGKVKTQYANLWTSEKDKFDGGDKFYIPKNVYIIGTMNDIDRSVESMDFAMRRRFAFKEVLVTERFSMIEENSELSNYAPTIKERMENLNNCILTIQGLSTAYQIGASYFLKLENYMDNGRLTDSSWESLWDNHLKGLLFEYLRGLPNADSDLKKLEEAYNLKTKYSKDVSEKIIIDDSSNE